MSIEQKKKDLPQIVEESLVVGLRSELAQVQTESQLFQQQVEDYQRRTADISGQTSINELSKKIKADFFQLLTKIIDILETVNSNVCSKEGFGC